MINRGPRLIALTAVVLALSAEPAFSQCIDFGKPKAWFDVADAVFVGTVVMNEPTGAQGFHVTVAVATLRVERFWKGRLEREIRVSSDAPFEVGKTYIVFAAGKPLSTTMLCPGTETIDRGKEKLDWLAKRRSHTPR